MEYIQIKTEEDIAILKPMFLEIFPEEANYDFAAYYDSIKRPHQLFDSLEYYFMVHDGNRIGICGLYSENEIDGWLGWFGVMPEYRNHGFARQCLADMEQLIKSRGFKVMRIYTNRVVNANAFRLYLKSGFIEDGGCDDNIVTLHKALTVMESPSLNWGNREPCW